MTCSNRNSRVRCFPTSGSVWMVFGYGFSVVLFVLACNGLFAQTGVTEHRVLYEWRGNDCEFKSSRPFFLIKDLHTQDRFWRSIKDAEPMPHVDFKNYMLFVWAPGPTMFDHDPVKVERFFTQGEQLIIQVIIERKKTGGYWRRPYLVTLLPRVDQKDIFIVRTGDSHKNETPLVHITTLFDMSTIRNRPIDSSLAATVKTTGRDHAVATLPKSSEDTDARVSRKPRTAEATVAAIQRVQPAPTQETPVQTAKVDQPVSRPSTDPGGSVDSRQGSQWVGGPAATKAKTEQATAGKPGGDEWDELFELMGESDSSGKSQEAKATVTKTEPKAAPKAEAKADPMEALFGDDFNIEF